LYYKTDIHATYQSTAMMNTSGINWEGQIPGQAIGTTVYYYIDAVANNSKQLSRPITAPEGYWKFNVWDAPLSITEQQLPVAFESVYPNPASSITVVPVNSYANTQATIRLVNQLGQTVSTLYDGAISQGTNKFFFDAGELASGIYSVVIETEYGRDVQKVVVE